MSICGFISNPPEEFPWEYGIESAPHAEFIKQIEEAIGVAVEWDEIDTFCCEMSDKADWDFAEVVLSLKENKYPKIKLICVVDSEPKQNLSEQEIERYNTILQKADKKSRLIHFSILDKCKQFIAAWNGQKSGQTWEKLYFATQKSVYFVRLKDIKADTDEPNGILKRELRDARESSKRCVFAKIAYTFLIEELIAKHPDPVATFKATIKKHPYFKRDITDLAETLKLNLDVD